jgi:hypothetical protein
MQFKLLWRGDWRQPGVDFFHRVTGQYSSLRRTRNGADELTVERRSTYTVVNNE